MIPAVTYQLDMDPLFRSRVKLEIGLGKVAIVRLGEVRRGEAVFFFLLFKKHLTKWVIFKFRLYFINSGLQT